MKRIVLGENSRVLPTLPAGFARLCYIDPPFNTGKVQKRARMRVSATRGSLAWEARCKGAPGMGKGRG